MDVSPRACGLGPEVEIGVIGAGTMGSGIAQVAAVAGHRVRLFDARDGAAKAAMTRVVADVEKLAEKGRLEHDCIALIRNSLLPIDSLRELHGCGLVIEAISEDLAAKRELFRNLEESVGDGTILATNTSSLSITAIAGALRAPERVAGMHFFNPAPLMPLVEIVSGAATAPPVMEVLQATASRWGKTPVSARSTPGFIVNRVARAFYGEALRLLNEGAADCATIDAVMREAGGFRMGPFELMDLIGLDVNYAVTRSVYEATFCDPRFTPSVLQRELVDAGYLGRKAGRGFYTYPLSGGSRTAAPSEHHELARRVCLFGDDPLARTLRERLSTTAVQVTDAPRHQDGRIAEGPWGMLYRTDGRTATRRSAQLANKCVVVVDLAWDYSKASRLAIAAADQATPATLEGAAGLLQAAGFAVSPIDDAAGLVVMRTVAMLANEAADAVHQGVCTVGDCDRAMQLGMNYPRGPLAWADELDVAEVAAVLDNLAEAYGETRYRVSPLLRRKAISGTCFHPAKGIHSSMS